MNGKQPWPDPGVFSKGIFSALPESEWKTLGLSPPTVYARKTPIFEEGSPASHAYLIGAGLVKTYRNPSHDRVQIINILTPGAVVGAEALTRDVYSGSAATLTRALLFPCEKTRFLEVMKNKPSVSLTLIRMLNEESGNIQSLICDLGTKKALPRVASCLLLIMDKQNGPGTTAPFNLPITRQEMGALLGLSPETVSRQLKDLIDARVIRLAHKRVTVVNLPQLRAIAAS